MSHLISFRGEEFGTAHHLCEPDVFGLPLMSSILYTFTGVDLYFARVSSLNWRFSPVILRRLTDLQLSQKMSPPCFHPSITLQTVFSASVGGWRQLQSTNVKPKCTVSPSACRSHCCTLGPWWVMGKFFQQGIGKSPHLLVLQYHLLLRRLQTALCWDSHRHYRPHYTNGGAMPPILIQAISRLWYHQSSPRHEGVTSAVNVSQWWRRRQQRVTSLAWFIRRASLGTNRGAVKRLDVTMTSSCAVKDDFIADLDDVNRLIGKSFLRWWEHFSLIFTI